MYFVQLLHPPTKWYCNLHSTSMYFAQLFPQHLLTTIQMCRWHRTVKKTGCVFNDTVHPLWMGYRLVVSSFHPAQLPEMYFSQMFPKPIIYVHSTCMYMTCFYRVCTYRNCTHKVCVHVQSLFTNFYLSALNTFVHMIPDWKCAQGVSTLAHHGTNHNVCTGTVYMYRVCQWRCSQC